MLKIDPNQSFGSADLIESHEINQFALLKKGTGGFDELGVSRIQRKLGLVKQGKERSLSRFHEEGVSFRYDECAAKF